MEISNYFLLYRTVIPKAPWSKQIHIFMEEAVQSV